MRHASIGILSHFTLQMYIIPLYSPKQPRQPLRRLRRQLPLHRGASAAAGLFNGKSSFEPSAQQVLSASAQTQKQVIGNPMTCFLFVSAPTYFPGPLPAKYFRRK